MCLWVGVCVCHDRIDLTNARLCLTIGFDPLPPSSSIHPPAGRPARPPARARLSTDGHSLLPDAGAEPLPRAVRRGAGAVQGHRGGAPELQERHGRARREGLRQGELLQGCRSRPLSGSFVVIFFNNRLVFVSFSFCFYPLFYLFFALPPHFPIRLAFFFVVLLCHSPPILFYPRCLNFWVPEDRFFG